MYTIAFFFGEVYGIYYTYEDLLVAEVDWSIDKSNKELMVEVKKELFEALKMWNDKIKPLID